MGEGLVYVFNSVFRIHRHRFTPIKIICRVGAKKKHLSSETTNVFKKWKKKLLSQSKIKVWNVKKKSGLHYTKNHYKKFRRTQKQKT